MKAIWREWLALAICLPALAMAAAPEQGPSQDKALETAIANGAIDVFTVQGANVYLGGDFTEVDRNAANAIAR